MAKFIVLKSFRVAAGQTLIAGSTIDDLLTDVTGLKTRGLRVAPAGLATFAAAAERCTAARLRGAYDECDAIMQGAVDSNLTDDSLEPTSKLAGLVSPLSEVSVMHTGHSQVTGSSTSPGGLRTHLWRLFKQAGIPARFKGPVNAPNVQSTSDLRPEPGDPWCAGYAGKTIAEVTAYVQQGGLIYAYVQSFGAATFIPIELGLNDISAGMSGEDAWAAMQKLIVAYQVLCPNSLFIIQSCGKFYTGSAPTDGIDLANARVATFNALAQAGASALGLNVSFCDTSTGFTASDVTSADGVHELPHAHAKKAARLFTHMVSLRPGMVLSAECVPRPPRLRTATPMVKFTANTDKLETTVADDGWRIPASNFLVGGWFMFQTLPTALTNLMYSAPGAQNYTHGFELAFNGSTTPKTLNFYMQGYSDTHAGGPAVFKQAPIIAGKPFAVFVHGDRDLGVVSLWIAMQERGPGGPWTICELDAATGIAPWSASDASPMIHFGNYADGGFIGALAGAFMAAGVTGRAGIRAEIERIIYDGAAPAGVTASLPCTEGSGATCASGIGGQAATLTGGGWYAAGDIPRIGDDRCATIAAAATDLTTSITLVNDLRTKLINLGVIQ